MLYKQPADKHVSGQGPFTIRRLFPGFCVPGHGDHGYGPLAAVDDATLEPDTTIGMHKHLNDEIVSYVHQGVMHHNDSSGVRLNIDSSNLMVMNAGNGFWHEERVYKSDETTRTLQIFIRPHTVKLEPKLQHLSLEDPKIGSWRYLLGPEGGKAETTVRNDVQIFDGHLHAGTASPLPSHNDWDTYFVVLRGALEVKNQPFKAVESGLLINETACNVQVKRDALVVIFLVNRNARLTYDGTIGQ